MKKQILTLSIIASLSACQYDNSSALQVPADFTNIYTNEVGFDGSSGEGMDIPLTSGHGNATGNTVVTDVNLGEAAPDYTKLPEGMYGTFTMVETIESETGHNWTYTINNEHPDVIAIRDDASATLTDSLTLTSIDGTTKDLNFVIQGVDPSIPAIFRGAFVANVSLTEVEGFGTAQVYDENYNESFFQRMGPLEEGEVLSEDDIVFEGEGPKYGILTLAANGKWVYVLNKRHPDFDDWDSPEDSTFEEFTIKSADGTEKTFRVNITGAPLNFAANIPSETDETNVFAINLMKGQRAYEHADLTSGKLVFKAKVTEDLAAKSALGMTCGKFDGDSRWHTNNDGGGDNRRMAQLYVNGDKSFQMWSAEIKPGGSYANGNTDYAKNADNKFITELVTFNEMFEADEWAEIEMTWDYDGAKLTKMTMSFNGSPVTSDHGAIPADPTEKFVAQSVAGASLSKCLQEMRFTVRKSTDKGGAGAMLIDDIKFFTNIDADVRFDTPDFEEAFTTYNEGAQLNDSEQPKFDNITTDMITVVKDR